MKIQNMALEAESGVQSCAVRACLTNLVQWQLMVRSMAIYGKNGRTIEVSIVPSEAPVTMRLQTISFNVTSPVTSSLILDAGYPGEEQRRHKIVIRKEYTERIMLEYCIVYR